MAVQGRTFLDLFLCQIDDNIFVIGIHSHQRIRGDQHLAAREPSSRTGDQIADGPMPVVEVEFLDLPDGLLLGGLY